MSAPITIEAPASRPAALWADLKDLAGSDARLFAFAKLAAWCWCR